MNINDSFLDLLNDDSIKKVDNTPFELNNIKLVHYHFYSGDIYPGTPFKTSIELASKYNFEKQILIWTKTITHEYYSLTGNYGNTIDTFSSELSDSDFLIKELSEIDLRLLKNNYFTQRDPEQFTHWEICYNHHFKIVGTYDQEIYEMKKLSELLGFKNVINEQCEKINMKLNQAK